MNTFRTAGIVSGMVILFLSTGTALAQTQPERAVMPGAGAMRTRSADVRVGATASTTHMRETARETVQARVQAARAEVHDRVAAQQAKVAERLAAIQDKVKQQIAGRLATQFGTLNEKWTDRFANLLDRHEAILQKIQDRAAAAAAAGKDVSAATAAIQSAQNAIANARAAIEAQAAKDYTPDTSAAIAATASTTTPAGQAEILKNVRASFQNMHRVLFDDLFVLRDGPLVGTRQAIQDALRALQTVPGVDDVATASTTAATTED